MERILTKKENRTLVKQAIHMSWPSVMESFFVALTSMIDSFMVSSYGAYAVSAIGLAAQPRYMGLAFFLAINVAVSALVSRRKGEGKRDEANKVLLVALIITIVVGIFVSIACVFFAGDIIRISGSSKDTHESAVSYFKLIMGLMIFNIISLVINAAQRGVGNTKIAMRTNITSNIIHIIGNYLLIQGHFGLPAMGVTGAALASVIGTAAACVMGVLSLTSKEQFLSFHYILEQHIKPTMKALKSLFSISYSVFFEQILLRIGFISIAIMAAKQGTNNFAAHQVGMNVLQLSFSFGDGMQAAAVSLIGQSLGRGEPWNAQLYGRICQRIGYIISMILSVLYFLFGEAFFRMFFDKEEIIHVGIRIMYIMIAIVIFQITQVIYLGCLRGAGDTLYTTLITLISVTIIRTGFSYFFCYVAGFGVLGIWYGTLADQLTRYLLTSIRFKSGKWTKIKI